jgi:hypothetical protein
MIKMMYSNKNRGKGTSLVYEGSAVVAGDTNDYSYDEICKCTSSTVDGLGNVSNTISMCNV